MPGSSRIRAVTFMALFLFVMAFLTGCGDDADPLSLSVNPESKDSVTQLYKTVYLPDQTLDPGWTGSVAACNPGTITLAYRQATVRRVNYYRALCQLPAVSLDEDQSAKCQHAALIMSANRSLSHTPPNTWLCWTQDGYDAASHANLALGSCGPPAIGLYMDDYGTGNAAVGHRRWILSPPLAKVGTGSVPAASGYQAADALWVVGNAGDRPATPEYVAWPSAGWFPKQHLPTLEGRWSFSVNGADWSQTSISTTRNGVAVTIRMEAVNNAGYGDRTIVWCPTDGTANRFVGPEDVWNISVNNVLINGQSKNYNYTIRVFDPETL